ncbi:MAG: hypothetical protein ACRDMJ_01110, partial [Solirubrobacteraceae bacterium]
MREHVELDRVPAGAREPAREQRQFVAGADDRVADPPAGLEVVGGLLVQMRKYGRSASSYSVCSYCSQCWFGDREAGRTQHRGGEFDEDARLRPAADG